MKKIVVVGSSNTDLVIKTGRIPQPGETVLGGTFMMTPGGKGANQAVTVARLGEGVVFIARVGNDMFGESSLDGYKKDGIDTSHIIRDGQTPSGVALISVDAKGENSIVVAPGANSSLTVADIEANRKSIEKAEYLLMQLEVPMDVIEHAARIAHEADTKIILNPAPAAALSKELISRLYLITPNAIESQTLTGIEVSDWETAEKAAKALLDMGARNVVITLGSSGALICNRDFCERIPALKVEAQDTTAAGDTFNGALCVALSEGRTLSESVRFATHAAAISVTRMGAQSSIPCRAELDDAIKNMKEMQ